MLQKTLLSLLWVCILHTVCNYVRMILSTIASGDLRHVIRTTNALPSDFSGKLSFLINDISTPTVCRNVILLLILGTVPDKSLAADIALHFWCSVFWPIEYLMQTMLALISWLECLRENEIGQTYPLGPGSTISTCIPADAFACFKHFISSSTSTDDAQAEYDRVRTIPSRKDYRERMYANLRPSHRVAFQKYRRSGIILPFGANITHFNATNLSLFSFDGSWLQTDFADPLQGWE